MTVHRFDNPRIFTVRSHNPPIARGHRSWLRLREGLKRASGETAKTGSTPKGRKPGPKGRAHD